MPADTRLIGYEVGTTGSFPVERGKIHEFATALLDDNPVFHDPTYAASSPFGGIPAPPTFTMVQQHWGAAMENVPDVGLDFSRVLHGGQEFEYLKPIMAGDTLTGHGRIADIYEKAGKRGGTMTFVILEIEFTNQRNEKVATSRTVVIETSKPAV